MLFDISINHTYLCTYTYRGILTAPRLSMKLPESRAVTPLAQVNRRAAARAKEQAKAASADELKRRKARMKEVKNEGRESKEMYDEDMQSKIMNDEHNESLREAARKKTTVGERVAFFLSRMKIATQQYIDHPRRASRRKMIAIAIAAAISANSLATETQPPPQQQKPDSSQQQRKISQRQSVKSDLLVSLTNKRSSVGVVDVPQTGLAAANATATAVEAVSHPVINNNSDRQSATVNTNGATAADASNDPIDDAIEGLIPLSTLQAVEQSVQSPSDEEPPQGLLFIPSLFSKDIDFNPFLYRKPAHPRPLPRPPAVEPLSQQDFFALSSTTDSAAASCGTNTEYIAIDDHNVTSLFYDILHFKDIIDDQHHMNHVMSFYEHIDTDSFYQHIDVLKAQELHMLLMHTQPHQQHYEDNEDEDTSDDDENNSSSVLDLSLSDEDSDEGMDSCRNMMSSVKSAATSASKSQGSTRSRHRSQRSRAMDTTVQPEGDRDGKRMLSRHSSSSSLGSYLSLSLSMKSVHNPLREYLTAEIPEIPLHHHHQHHVDPVCLQLDFDRLSSAQSLFKRFRVRFILCRITTYDLLLLLYVDLY